MKTRQAVLLVTAAIIAAVGVMVTTLDEQAKKDIQNIQVGAAYIVAGDRPISASTHTNLGPVICYLPPGATVVVMDRRTAQTALGHQFDSFDLRIEEAPSMSGVCPAGQIIHGLAFEDIRGHLKKNS